MSRPSQRAARLAAILLLGVAAGTAAAPPTASAPVVGTRPDSSNAALSSSGVDIRLDGTRFEVTGWRPPASSPGDDWSSVLAIYAGVGDVPQLLGRYAIERGELVFHPRFPFTPGMRYRAVFTQPGARPIERWFTAPPADRRLSTRILQIYPSADVLPSNTLRLYVYFSAPMSHGEAATHIHLLDAQGQALEGVFLPSEELWDPQGERLTMTLDPGRIKRGLTSNKAMGPPIAPGQAYTLVIDQDWPDARGAPLIQGLRKSFHGGPADRNPPDPASWHLSVPPARSELSLVVDFPKSMNYPLLQRMLQVVGPRGAVAGTIQIERQETRWRFIPQRPWEKGAYRLVVDTDLEDLAGNHIGQPFDLDVFERVTEHIVTQTVNVPFVVVP